MEALGLNWFIETAPPEETLGLPDVTVCNAMYYLVYTDTMKQGSETFKCSQNWLQKGQLQYQLSRGIFTNFQGTKTLKLQHPSTHCSTVPWHLSSAHQWATTTKLGYWNSSMHKTVCHNLGTDLGNPYHSRSFSCEQFWLLLIKIVRINDDS